MHQDLVMGWTKRSVEDVDEREQKGFGGFRKGGVCWRQESQRSGNSAFERHAPSACDEGGSRDSTGRTYIDRKEGADVQLAGKEIE